MTTLSEAEIAYLHSELGSDIDDTDLQLRYDRLSSVGSVALEVVSERLADLLNAGPGFSIPGVYSEQSNDALIKALTASRERLTLVVAGEAEDAAVAAGEAVSPGRLVRSDWGR